jgi:hypothetical protein
VIVSYREQIYSAIAIAIPFSCLLCSIYIYRFELLLHTDVRHIMCLLTLNVSTRLNDKYYVEFTVSEVNRYKVPVVPLCWKKLFNHLGIGITSKE